MISILRVIVIAITLLSFPLTNYAQAPNLGTAANFVLFTSVGAVTHNGISQITGNVGSNSGAGTGFGNVNGVMHSQDSATAKAASDLLIAYNQLFATTPTFNPSNSFGNGATLIAGVYSVTGASTLNGDMILDAQGNSNAVFIFQIHGALSAGANSKVKLINGAQACNVYWMIGGLVSLASGTTMRGTMIVNNAAITMSAGDTLEGRALSTNGAIGVDGVMAYTPVGCGSPTLTGPNAPSLGTIANFGIFSGNGSVSNSGTTNVTGDVGTDVGLTTGFDSLLVTGIIHPDPDGTTAQASADLLVVYDYLNTLPYDIELLYPAQFGRNLVLTPHTYVLKGATMLTDTLFLNAMGNSNAVFVIQINGAFSTSNNSRVILTNGTQAKNVFWKIDGAVEINDNSIFSGTIVANNGAIDVKTGVLMNGRALTTDGAVSIAGATVIIPTTAVSNTPVITSTTPGSTCGTGTVDLEATSNTGTINWYANITGGTSLATGTSYTTPSISITTTYYVDATNGTITSSPRTAIDATVNTSPPTITSTTPGSTCGSGQVTLKATASAGTLSWYDDALTGTALGTGNTFITPVISISTTYYVEAVSGTCPASSRTAVIASVNATSPIITGTTAGSRCGSGAVNLSATASEGTISWYANITGGTALKTGPSFTTPVITISTTYFVNTALGSCTMANRTAVVATVNTPPSITSTTPASICGAGTVILGATASAGTIKWFSSLSGGTAIGTGASFTTPSISQSTTYFVNASVGTCTTPARSSVVATVVPIPTITSTSPSFTNGGGTVVLGATASAGTINWYDNLTTGTSLGTGISFTTPFITVSTPYYVDATVGNCVSSSRTSVLAIVNSNVGIQTLTSDDQIAIYPNPFTTSATVVVNNVSALNNTEMRIYNALGKEVMKMSITGKETILETSALSSGIFFYIMSSNDQVIQTGRLVSQK